MLNVGRRLQAARSVCGGAIGLWRRDRCVAARQGKSRGGQGRSREESRAGEESREFVDGWCKWA
jgi:hypothetical protein